MSEKRFEKTRSDITDWRIYDYEEEDAYFIDCDDEGTVDALVDLLNNLDSTITDFEDANGTLEKENIRLREQLNRLQTSLNYWQNLYKEALDQLPPKVKEVWLE